MGARASEQAVVGSQAFRWQQDGSVGQWICLLPCVGLSLSRSFQVSGPMEGGGGKPTGPGAEQSQRGVIQSRLHRTGGGAIGWVCGDKIWRNVAVMFRSGGYVRSSGPEKVPVGLQYSGALGMKHLNKTQEICQLFTYNLLL